MDKAQFIIQTFTMQADFAEDRIRLDAVDAAGVFQSIWYSRRLADRFLPHFAAHAEKSVDSGLPKDLLLSMNQEQLRIERAENPHPPVQPTVELRPWLAQTVHLNEGPEGLIWTMTDDRTIDAHMVLSDEAERSVLDVFLTTYRTLEWSDHPFPDWVRDAAAQPAPVPPESLN